MRATIRDVAREAGVSIATVSRVLRDSTAVRPTTRDRVLAAADELEFVPSALGRQLAERRHAANGIVFPDLSGPYYAEVVLGYESVAAELGRSVLILSTRDRPDAESAVQAMAERCDGLVVLGRTVPDAAVERLVVRGAHVVMVARPPVGGADSVNARNRQGARALTEHLLDLDVRRLVFVGDPSTSPDVAERLRGIQEALPADADLQLHHVDSLDEECGAHVVGDYLTRALPDAFVCANDELALGMLGRLSAAGVDLPGRVKVAGWDDVMAARYAGLTTVRQPMRELGATAARLLDELISGSRSHPTHELLPTQLVVRSTTLGKVAP
ncbi:LacI family DNA-binding transcriptional regulator [Nocardioides sp. MAH-18]|uniref:LacI family DNA-binding transcriptional regulator n=1 Tax=Nocardioides agri TaxID=2682843 RepID=A0A6L6XWE2_9ACTN|nr:MULTISPECIES: LacI family DNA-binding transcriptional regulator [unclassified Nocardioides]MBA2955937.1 LacI family DNA-binding transcriptional regulator [Nocardioides sp. CGMCC 1.13656]MVQ50786.1 LacI family DNA-binding transcriptional regulator [Nocardioides sp. MAH-18]